jgi:CobQ-like glutamine amidotransferase family enzyme
MTLLTLAHLYPREMNIYGDTGNVLVLRKRLQWRGRDAEVVGVHVGDPLPPDTDILLGGGGQDAAQGEIGRDFVSRGAELRAMADDGVVMLTICGSYQLLGHHFLTKDGRRIEGVGVLDVVTTGSDQRLIGNNSIDTEWGRLVGFENHSGLTELGPGARPLGRTMTGRGNNGQDQTEGAVRDNVFGTYLHGPVLAKSPRFADDLLRRAYARGGVAVDLEPLDDTLPELAARVAVGRPR